MAIVYPYSLALVAAASMLLIYSIILCRKIIPAIEWPYMRKSWRLLSFMIFLSLIGYGFYLYILSSEILHELNDYLLGAILFYEAVLIMIASRASNQLVDGIKTSEVNIIQNKHTLERDQGSIEKMKNDLEEKNEEMEKLLAEIYAIKQIMEKRGARGKPALESRRMNRILDEIRKDMNAMKKKQE